MSHVLLLSPDDQVVNAITAVLDELSLICDRPLDGVSAAQKLNSTNYDLVLVDCENLPAAKLIFDVCRRGKNGHNPVPIAIVDGRAGMPTAFRLGAELILTKPVAKDQARTTIRAAVARVKKDVPVRGATQSSSPSADSQSANADWSKGLSAVASPPLSSFSDSTPGFMRAKAAAPVAVKTPSPADELHNSPVVREAAAGAVDSASVKPKIPFAPSDDPVLAELERTELEAAEKPLETREVSAEPVLSADHTTDHQHAPVFTSYQDQKKHSRAFVALMTLVIAAGGLYGTWMYEPGFRSIVQPQIDWVIAEIALHQTHAEPARQIVAQPAPAPAPAPTPAMAETQTGADLNQASTSAAETTTTAASPASGTTDPSPIASATSQTPAAVHTPEQPNTAAAAVAGKSVAGDSDSSKAVATKPSQPRKMQATAPPLDAPLPEESSAIILSSKGAEKRLAHSVPAKYPVDARTEGVEGTVVLKEVVDENGKVTGVRLVEGNASLANAAMQAVKQWRYRPYVRDGKAQPFQTVVIVDFQKP